METSESSNVENDCTANNADNDESCQAVRTSETLTMQNAQ